MQNNQKLWQALNEYSLYIYALKFDISNATSEQGTNHENHKQVYPGMN